MCVRIRLQAISEYSRCNNKPHIYTWSKDQRVVVLDSNLLGHIRETRYYVFLVVVNKELVVFLSSARADRVCGSPGP